MENKEKVQEYQLIAFMDNDLLCPKVIVDIEVGDISKVRNFMDENLTKLENCNWWLKPLT